MSRLNNINLGVFSFPWKYLCSNGGEKRKWNKKSLGPRSRRCVAKWHLLNMTRPSHSWNCSSSGCLDKTKPINNPTRWGEIHTAPLLSKELLSVDVYCKRQGELPLWIWSWAGWPSSGREHPTPMHWDSVGYKTRKEEDISTTGMWGALGRGVGRLVGAGGDWGGVRVDLYIALHTKPKINLKSSSV